MQLVLWIMFFFILVGLIPRGFGRRQQAIVVTSAVALAAAQFFFSRFL